MYNSRWSKTSLRLGSALEHSAGRRRRVQFPLGEPESRAESQRLPELGHCEAAPQEEQVPQAGPRPAVLPQHQRQLERGHHAGVQRDALQAPAALVQLQVDVEDAAPQAAGLAGRQAQDLVGHAPHQALRHQHGGAVQHALLGVRQTGLQHLGQLLAAPVLGAVGRPRGLRPAPLPRFQPWGRTADRPSVREAKTAGTKERRLVMLDAWEQGFCLFVCCLLFVFYCTFHQSSLPGKTFIGWIILHYFFFPNWRSSERKLTNLSTQAFILATWNDKHLNIKWQILSDASAKERRWHWEFWFWLGRAAWQHLHTDIVSWFKLS